MSWYSTGSVAVTNGSATIIGTGTSWVRNVRVGDAFRGPDKVFYEVGEIVSDTEITLATAYDGATVSGASYTITPTTSHDKELAEGINGILRQAERQAFSYATRADLVAAQATGKFAVGALANAGGVSYRYTGTGTEIPDLLGWVPEGIPQPQHWGGRGDGINDDTAALQALLDYCEIGRLTAGKWRTTGPLYIDPIRNRGCGLEGMVEPSIYSSTTQAGGPVWDGDDEAMIFYDGPTGQAVIHASAEAIGVEPASTFQDTIWGLYLRNIVINGNAKARFGLYGARVQNGNVENVIVRETAEDGFYLNGIYSGLYKNLVARKTGGRGISFGAAQRDYGWTVNDKCNAVTLIDLWAYACGTNGTYDQSTNATACAGVYFAPHRACHIIGGRSEYNDGPGYVFEPNDVGNTISKVYTELNNTLPTAGGISAIAAGRATKQMGILYIGKVSNFACRVQDAFLGGEHLDLIGTEPSTGRPGQAPAFINISGAAGLRATWPNYRLEGWPRTVVPTVNQPTGYHDAYGGVAFGGGQVLKNYDHGTFTPTLVGSTDAGTQTYSRQTGFWTRIGNTIHVEGECWLASTSGATGAIEIDVSGLPLPISANTNYRAFAGVPYWLGLTSSPVGGYAEAGTTRVRLQRATGGSSSTIAATEMTASTRIGFHFSYRV